MPRTADTTIRPKTSGSVEGKFSRTSSRLNFFPADEVDYYVARISHLDQCNGQCQVCPNPCGVQAGVLEAQANDRQNNFN